MNRDLLARAVSRPGEAPVHEWGEGLWAHTLEWLEPGPVPAGTDGLPGHGTWRVEMAPGTSWRWSEGPSVDLFVVEGTLRESDRALPPGTFARREEATWVSDEGATVLVKRLPRLPHAPRVAMVGPDEGAFEPSYTRGLHLKELVDDGPRRTVLLRFDSGTTIGDHRHDHGEELFVWRGQLIDDFGIYDEGTWIRQPPGSHHRVQAPQGCTLLTVSGHL